MDQKRIISVRLWGMRAAEWQEMLKKQIICRLKQLRQGAAITPKSKGSFKITMLDTETLTTNLVIAATCGSLVDNNRVSINGRALKAER